MFISQTGLTYFYKWPITCKIQILNLIASVEVGFAIDVTRGFPFSPLLPCKEPLEPGYCGVWVQTIFLGDLPCSYYINLLTQAVLNLLGAPAAQSSESSLTCWSIEYWLHSFHYYKTVYIHCIYKIVIVYCSLQLIYWPFGQALICHFATFATFLFVPDIKFLRR
jgi:hypothetical protein